MPFFFFLPLLHYNSRLEDRTTATTAMRQPPIQRANPIILPLHINVSLVA